MDIRPARRSDLPAALELWRAALAATGARPSAARTAATQERLGSRRAVLVVAGDEGDGLEGLALGEWVTGDDGAFVPGLLRLAMVVVHPRARRQGVGSALADALADAAWPKGARRLVATPDDDAARAFLAACGLEPDGEDMTGELEPPVRDLEVRQPGLRLGQLLKLAGMVETGAEAKERLEAGEVEVDGEVETRRGRQLRTGEVVATRGDAVRVHLPDASSLSAGVQGGVGTPQG